MQKKLSKKQKNYYKKIIIELGYSSVYIERLDQCSNERECQKILEYARVESIDLDFENKSNKQMYHPFSG